RGWEPTVEARRETATPADAQEAPDNRTYWLEGLPRQRQTCRKTGDLTRATVEARAQALCVESKTRLDLKEVKAEGASDKDDSGMADQSVKRLMPSGGGGQIFVSIGCF